MNTWLCIISYCFYLQR